VRRGRSQMSSKERMLAAFRNQQPDMVPVAPDISNMIPARLTGKPFWDIYLYGDPPLWRAYVDAVRYFGFDGWFTYGSLAFQAEDERTWETATVRRTEQEIVTRTVCHMPGGDLAAETTFRSDLPPVMTRKWVEDAERDLPKLRHFFPGYTGFDDTPLREQMREMGDLGVVGAGVELPGLQDLVGWFGDLETVVFTYHDYHDLLLEVIERQKRSILTRAEMILSARPDFLLIDGSGLWTLQSPTIFRELSLPTLKELTRMAKEAGIPSCLHACGKSRQLVEICALETDLSIINPLETAPMGDCDLAEVKERYGSRIALMGNLHTTEVMLLGTPRDVERAARDCITAAARNGGFVLSTGDQCGRDTPDENIFALVRAAREHGRY